MIQNQSQAEDSSNIKVQAKKQNLLVQQKPVQRYIIADGAFAPIQKLVEVMMVVNTKSPEAKLNATSISDNNGGRIQLNDPTIPKPDFTKVIPNK